MDATQRPFSLSQDATLSPKEGIQALSAGSPSLVSWKMRLFDQIITK